MKVLIVAPYFYPKIGGVENHTYYIAKGLQRRGHSILVVTTNHLANKYTQENVEGLDVIRLSKSFKISNTPISPYWYFQLRRIIKREKPDIIEAHSPVPGLADIAFAVKGKTKFVIKYHSGSMKKGKRATDLLITVYEKFILKKILRESHGIMSVYPTFINTLIGENKNMSFIPPGVNIDKFRPKKDAAKTTDILYVGRIERSSQWKGIGTLLDAVAQIAKENPNIKLNLVGSGDAVKGFKQKAIELGIQKNIKFSGPLNAVRLVSIYNSSRVLVLPSETESESFGNVLIEAMACGTPVIGSNIGGIPNVIKDGKNGFLTPPKDPVKLASTINKVIYDPELSAKLAKCGRAHVEKHFTEDLLISRTEDFLRKIYFPKNNV